MRYTREKAAVSKRSSQVVTCPGKEWLHGCSKNRHSQINVYATEKRAKQTIVASNQRLSKNDEERR
jgi:hypothetical protein